VVCRVDLLVWKQEWDSFAEPDATHATAPLSLSAVLHNVVVREQYFRAFLKSNEHKYRTNLLELDFWVATEAYAVLAQSSSAALSHYYSEAIRSAATAVVDEFVRPIFGDHEHTLFLPEQTALHLVNVLMRYKPDPRPWVQGFVTVPVPPPTLFVNARRHVENQLLKAFHVFLRSDFYHRAVRVVKGEGSFC
jgi:hypothetical protein